MPRRLQKAVDEFPGAKRTPEKHVFEFLTKTAEYTRRGSHITLFTLAASLKFQVTVVTEDRRTGSFSTWQAPKKHNVARTNVMFLYVSDNVPMFVPCVPTGVSEIKWTDVVPSLTVSTSNLVAPTPSTMQTLTITPAQPGEQAGLSEEVRSLIDNIARVEWNKKKVDEVLGTLGSTKSQRRPEELPVQPKRQVAKKSTRNRPPTPSGSPVTVSDEEGTEESGETSSEEPDEREHLEALRSSLKTLQEAVAGSMEELGTLQEMKKRLDDTGRELQEQKDATLAAEAKTLKEREEAIKNRVQRDRSLMEEFRIKKEKDSSTAPSTQQQEELRKENDVMKQAVKRTQEEYRQLEKKWSFQYNRSQKLEEELKDRDNSTRTAWEQRNEARRELEMMNEMNEQHQQTFNILQDRNTELEAENDRLHGKIKQLEERVKESEEFVSSVQTSLAKLTPKKKTPQAGARPVRAITPDWADEEGTGGNNNLQGDPAPIPPQPDFGNLEDPIPDPGSQTGTSKKSRSEEGDGGETGSLPPVPGSPEPEDNRDKDTPPPGNLENPRIPEGLGGGAVPEDQEDKGEEPEGGDHNDDDPEAEQGVPPAKKRRTDHGIERGGNCPQCGQSFETTRQLNTHTSTAHTDPWKCTAEGCTKAFGTRKQLRRHMDRHKELFFCEHCDKTFGVFYDLQQHMAFHEKEQTGRSDFQCDNCGAQLATQRAFNKHSKTCQVFNQRVCLISGCGSVLRNWWSLQQHWRAQHPKTTKEERKFKLLSKR